MSGDLTLHRKILSAAAMRLQHSTGRRLKRRIVELTLRAGASILRSHANTACIPRAHTERLCRTVYCEARRKQFLLALRGALTGTCRRRASLGQLGQAASEAGCRVERAADGHVGWFSAKILIEQGPA
jgi:hypothetical protein